MADVSKSQEESKPSDTKIDDGNKDKSMTSDLGSEDRQMQNSWSWVPQPEEVLKLFEELKKNKYFNFSWECPGRRNPYEEEKQAPEPEKPAFAKEAEVGADDFDFEEESTPNTLRRPGKTPQTLLKGSAKKRQTSLAGILSNMERHRIMDKMQTDDNDPS